MKKIMWLLVVAFVVIQFFRPEKNISTENSLNHISQKFPFPDDVKQIISTACYDCHSNNTKYPWYFSVQPIAWWLADDVKEGKKHLNFDEFASYNLRRQYKKFEGIGEELKEDEMPLGTYTAIHRHAILSPEQKEKIIQWSNARMNEMKATYPPDSLLKK
ncbi:MAG: heme-binding domain-containing protein [Bacteroidia bacterium]|nr:heme-binding domain-containing protein [Bacteroidia bacterium]